MSRPEKLLHYRLDLQETAASTGYFAAVPQKKTSLLEALAYLRRHPNDSLMHTHLLDVIGEMDLDAVRRLLDSEPGSDPRVRTLLFEAALVYEQLSTLKKLFKRRETKALADQTLHRGWASFFHANMNRHRPLPPPDKTGLVPPFEGIDGSDTPLTAQAHLKTIIESCQPDWKVSGPPRPPLEQTIDTAFKRLSALDLFDGAEMRHQSSLSPYALQRKWCFNHQVTCGTLDYTLASIQTYYGRGLSLEAARASCLMEVVERCSSFAGVTASGIVGTRQTHALIHGCLSQLTARGYSLLDPQRPMSGGALPGRSLVLEGRGALNGGWY